MRNRIKELYAKMRELLLDSGLQTWELSYSEKLLAALEDDEIKKLVVWLDDFKATSYAEYVKIYNFVEPHVWAGYKAHHITDLWECQQKRRAGSLLKKHWRRRPQFLKVNNPNQKEKADASD